MARKSDQRTITIGPALVKQTEPSKEIAGDIGEIVSPRDPLASDPRNKRKRGVSPLRNKEDISKNIAKRFFFFSQNVTETVRFLFEKTAPRIQDERAESATIEYLRAEEILDRQAVEITSKYAQTYFRDPKLPGFGIIAIAAPRVRGDNYILNILTNTFLSALTEQGDTRFRSPHDWITQRELPRNNVVRTGGLFVSMRLVVDNADGHVSAFVPHSILIHAAGENLGLKDFLGEKIDTILPEPWREIEDVTRRLLDKYDEFGRLLDRQTKREPGDSNYHRKRINEELTDLNDDPRWEKLDKFSRDNPGKPISSYVRELFPEIISSLSPPTSAAEPLPKRPPERWPTNPAKRTENPAEFATRVYRVWMDAGVLTRQDLKRLDPLLFASLDNWMKNNRRKPEPEPMPEGFRLFTIEQANSLWVDKVKSGALPFPDDPDSLAKFANALQYRALEGSKSFNTKS